jgi:glycosyltransferase involved in cell wall biosynthesis
MVLVMARCTHLDVRAVIAHDWLVSYAGSERVVEQLRDLFPAARLLATLADDAAVPPQLRGAETSFLQRIPGARSRHQWALPLMPLDWRLRRPIDDVEVVISSSHACAKAVRVAEGIPHVCYCHTPMRYAWDFEAERDRFPRAIRPIARLGMHRFRVWDRRISSRVTQFVANSAAVRDRIYRHYGREAVVVHPPVATDFFTPGEDREDFFLFVGRLVAYKRPDLVVSAFAALPYAVRIVGRGPMEQSLQRSAPPNVTFEQDVSPERLRSLYRRARAVVFLGEEDFGISMAEAQSCGTPVLARRVGGATDIVVDGETGVLLDDASAESLRVGVHRIASSEFDASAIHRHAQRFAPTAFRSGILEVLASVLRRGCVA